MEIKEKWRYSCLSVLFVKEGIRFEQHSKSSVAFPTKFRFVSGAFILPHGHLVVYKSSHIPCVDDSRPHISKQIDRKKRMLEAEIAFQQEYKRFLAISAGDFNGSAHGTQEGEYYCENLYDRFTFRDLIDDAPTFKEKSLDHVFASDEFSNEVIVSAKVIEDFYGYLTDHKIITITIEEA